MNRLECTLIPGYRGLMMLARRSKEIAAIDARVVKRGDVFEYEFGSGQFLRHKPGALTEAPRDAAGKALPFPEESPTIAAYMIAFFRGAKRGDTDGFQFEVMNRSNLERIKQFTNSKNRGGQIVGPWLEHEDAMFKKSVIRAGAKLLPFSIEMSIAVALDERAMVGRTQNLGAIAADYLGVDFSADDDDSDPNQVAGEASTTAPDAETVKAIDTLFDKLDMPEARRTVKLQEYKGRYSDLLEWLRSETAKPIDVKTEPAAAVRDATPAETERAEATKRENTAPSVDAIFGKTATSAAAEEPVTTEREAGNVTRPRPASKRGSRFTI